METYVALQVEEANLPSVKLQTSTSDVVQAYARRMNANGSSHLYCMDRRRRRAATVGAKH
jgi:hypothetical protein